MGSGSDELTVSAGAWRRFARDFAIGATAILVSLLAITYALDPFDTGRPGLFAKAGVRPQGPRTAGASRGRDPAFNAAVIGNSHIQLLFARAIGRPHRAVVRPALDRGDGAEAAARGRRLVHAPPPGRAGARDRRRQVLVPAGAGGPGPGAVPVLAL